MKHGGNIWEVIEKYKFKVEDILDFSSNINPFFDISKIKKIILSSLNEICFYPDPEYKKTRKKIAEKLGLSYKNIILGNGSSELIYLLPKALNLRKTLILIPTFSEYERAIKLNGGKIMFLRLREEEGFKINPNKIPKLLPHVDSFFLCNPNNPTGNFVEKEDVFWISKKMGDEKFLIIDEAFIDFTDKEGIAEKVKEIKNIFVLRTLTKIFPIPGIRIGYMCGNERGIEKISAFQYPWNVNCFAKNLIENLICVDVKEIREKIRKEKEYLYESLKSLKGIKVFKGEANFLLVKFEKGIILKDIIEKLKAKGILVRDCSNIRGFRGNFIRISVRRRGENKRLVKELKWLLNQ